MSWYYDWIYSQVLYKQQWAYMCYSSTGVLDKVHILFNPQDPVVFVLYFALILTHKYSFKSITLYLVGTFWCHFRPGREKRINLINEKKQVSLSSQFKMSPGQ